MQATRVAHRSAPKSLREVIHQVLSELLVLLARAAKLWAELVIGTALVGNLVSGAGAGRVDEPF